jgi:hypothetical protein
MYDGRKLAAFIQGFRFYESLHQNHTRRVREWAEGHNPSEASVDSWLTATDVLTLHDLPDTLRFVPAGFEGLRPCDEVAGDWLRAA